MEKVPHKANTKIAVNFLDETIVKKLFEIRKESPQNKFDSYLIAYIDFLGMKDKMKQENSFASLCILRTLLEGAQQKAFFIERINPIDSFDIKIFSDNIIIAQKIRVDVLCDQIISIINLVSLLQFEAFFQFGFPLRGGITIGNLYIDNSIVWGTGLIEAYQMENKVANYPRVIVSQRIIDEYDKCANKSLNINAFIKQDRDGLWFVDYFLASFNITVIPSLSNNLAEYSSQCATADDHVKQKINWIISYFNDCCHRFKDRGDYEKYVVPFI